MAITQGSYGQSMDYTVDMVFCIDATGSMEDFTGKQTKIINMVKQNAINFYGDFNNIMAEKGKKVRQLRVRIVAFRDYIADGEYAMMVTDFFQLPQQAAEFEACIHSIHADGGGDVPEDGLEALAYAIKSKWTTEGAKKRQVIVVWTDADTHALGFGSGSKFYPKGMPNDLGELSDWWDDATLMKGTFCKCRRVSDQLSVTGWYDVGTKQKTVAGLSDNRTRTQGESIRSSKITI